jgi:hypothetical protein
LKYLLTLTADFAQTLGAADGAAVKTEHSYE